MQKVTAAIIEKDGKILIARRKKGSFLEGKWEFPGGKLEPNETPKQCLKRELKEEFNIEAEIDDFFCSSKFTYHHMQIELLVYKASYISGRFELNDHDEIKWALPEELSKYDFIEADKTIVNKLLSEFC